MKISVLTGASGRIIAANYRIAARPAASSPDEIELPSELESSILKNTFGRGLASWKVQHEGKTPTLVKVS